MEQFSSVLLNLWREACRHIRIEESTQTIVELLAAQLPIRQALVRRVVQADAVIETVAVGAVAKKMGGDFGPEGADGDRRLRRVPGSNFLDRVKCSESQLRVVLDWCRAGRILHPQAGEHVAAIIEALVPEGVDGDVICGPLASGDADMGVLVLVARPGCVFEPRHERLAERLLEPFSAALTNDAAVRELEVLREAAEADKQSLLTKLGRKSLVETIIGAQTGLALVMERVELVAGSNVPVLIFGETGSGKEVIARAIHQRSSRAGSAFVRVNCGAIPSELVDSELFGHEKGAFTGAVASRKGWFERADGGTLFLDEIAELSPAAQVRLLRVLQDGWLERVGGHKPIHADVRVIAATNRNLEARVAERQFREDLWYRLAVFPVVLPPLRERRGDIPAMAEHFARKAAQRFGLATVMPTQEDVRLLESYEWPGNVREFATVIDRAAILGDGRGLEIARALGLHDTGASAAPLSRPTAPAEAPPTQSPVLALDEAMKEHIEKSLRAAQGRIEGPFGAAATLKINPNTLRARMRKLGINSRMFRVPR